MEYRHVKTTNAFVIDIDQINVTSAAKSDESVNTDTNLLRKTQTLSFRKQPLAALGQSIIA